jgi:multidrug efflux pump
MESMGPLSQIPGCRVIPLTASALPGGGDFPWISSSRRRPSPSARRIAQKLVQKAFASGMFIFADADLKFDQPQAEVVFDSRQGAVAGRRL